MSSLDMVQCTIHTTTCGGPKWTWQISLQELEARRAAHYIQHMRRWESQVQVPALLTKPQDCCVARTEHVHLKGRYLPKSIIFIFLPHNALLSMHCLIKPLPATGKSALSATSKRKRMVKRCSTWQVSETVRTRLVLVAFLAELWVFMVGGRQFMARIFCQLSNGLPRKTDSDIRSSQQRKETYKLNSLQEDAGPELFPFFGSQCTWHANTHCGLLLCALSLRKEVALPCL